VQAGRLHVRAAVTTQEHLVNVVLETLHDADVVKAVRRGIL